MDKVNESILSETILEDMKENRIEPHDIFRGNGSFGFRMLRKRLWRQ